MGQKADTSKIPAHDPVYVGVSLLFTSYDLALDAEASLTEKGYICERKERSGIIHTKYVVSIVGIS